MYPVLPRLYKKTSTGADQFWEIGYDGNTIITRWGQIDGKVQETRDVIAKGKNIGKRNETTPEQQALSEAQSQWEKKLKKGYVKDLADAREGKVDDIIEGGVSPMLAHKFHEQGHKLKYPLYGNPKLDGTRCIATIINGKCTLWSRTRKPVTSMPHIVAALESAFPEQTLSLDGELYAAHLNNDFEEIIHLVRSSEAVEGHDAIQYWVYDLPSSGTFSERYASLVQLLPDSPHLVLVEATLLDSQESAMEYFAKCVQQGFEGAILRNADGLYVGKRTPDLQKVKSMLDAEFRIVGVEEGRGKLAGHVGAFVCETTEGAKFSAKIKGKLANLKTYFEEPGSWSGKQLTVRYQNLTSDGIPRFPIGVAIRDYE